MVALNRGLVDGKTQTKQAWDEPLPDGSDLKIWYQIFSAKDSTPMTRKKPGSFYRKPGVAARGNPEYAGYGAEIREKPSYFAGWAFLVQRLPIVKFLLTNPSQLLQSLYFKNNNLPCGDSGSLATLFYAPSRFGFLWKTVG